jgi:general secretion pathway protein F
MPPARQGRLRGVRSALEQGSALSAALAAQGLLTPVAARFLQAGERSGQLAHMLAQAAAFHELEATRWLQRFGRLVEPVLMIGIGCVIGGIVLLLYMPVFDLAGTLP